MKLTLTKKELAQRLINGEVLYFSDTEYVYFDPTEHPPFRFNAGLGVSVPLDLWDVTEWRTKPKWYEDLKEPVLCWLWDYGDNPKMNAGLVYKYEEGSTWPYFYNSIGYRYATPICPDECYQGDLGGYSDE